MKSLNKELVMTQEDKELLLRDLGARLTYEVKAYVKNWSNLSHKYYEGVYTIYSVDPSLNQIYASKKGGSVEVILGHSDYVIKPYLFPLSSMTEEQYIEFISASGWNCDITDIRRGKFPCISYIGLGASYIGLGCIYNTIDWFNKNHFDYRGLIEKGLAIDATNLNIYS